MDVFNLKAKIILDSDEYEEELDQAASKTKKTGESLKASTVVIGNLMTDMIKKGAKSLVDLGKKGVAYNAQIEKYTSAIKTSLGGTAEAAKQAADVIDNIRKDAAATPFSLDGLAQANMLLISSGVNAKDARSTIMALSDAVSATGGGNNELQRMAANLQQIKNVGKATAMDIRQFQMAGIDIYGVIADYTGKTKAEIQDLEITYDLLAASLQHASSEGGRYFGANIEQSQTLNGMISTLADNVDQKLGEAFEGATDKLKELIPLATNFVQNLDVKEAKRDVGDLAISLGAVAAIFNQGKLAALGTKLATALKGIGAAATSTFGIVTATITGFILLCKASNESIKDMSDELGNYGETSEEVGAKIAEIKEKLADAKAAAEDNVELANLPMITVWENALAMLIPRYDELVAAEQAAADGANDIGDATEETGIVVDETLQGMAERYAETYAQISESVKSYFGLFEEARQVEAASIDDMVNNLKTQAEFNQKYSDSLKIMADSNIEGMDGITEAIAASGEKGAEFALAIADAIKSGDMDAVQPLIEAWNEVQDSQGDLTTTIASTTDAFQNLVEEAQGDADTIQAALDSLDGTTVNIYYNGVMTGNHMSGGVINGSHATGLDYVPFDGYIAELHKGERVMTAQENRAYNNNNNAAPTYEAIPVNIPVSIDIDGATVARKTYTYMVKQQEYHGDKLVNA